MILLGFLIISLQINFVKNASKRKSAVLDCTKRNSDGLYGRGCSSKFMRCYEGKLYVYRCRDKLKFNVETAKCEERRQVIACINNIDDDRAIVKADDPFDCSKKKDGVYGSGKCSTTYYHCSRGHSSEMLCPAGLYYNDKLKGCDEIDSVDECNVLTALQGFNERRESHLGERGKYIERNLLSIRNGPILDTTGGKRRLSLDKEKKSGKGHKSNNKKRPIRQTLYRTSLWKPEEELNCTGMSDGNYPMIKRQCSKYFWRCSDGKTTRRVCRDKLFFNTITGKCDMAKNIEDCIDKKPLITKSTTESNCITLNEDVVERSACSRFYYNCTAGELFQLQCPEDQVYDLKQNQCDHIEFVPECRNAENPSSSSTPNPIQMSKITAAPELNGFCNTTDDGLFSAGCENYFYFCTSGHGYHVKCPEGLFFDIETRTCNYEEHVPLCNLALQDSRTTDNEEAHDYTTVPQSIDQGDESREVETYDTQTEKMIHDHTDHIPEASLPALVSVPIPKTKTLPFLPEDFDCLTKSDGFYSIGCKTEFIACANHRMFFFECPHNLIFNEEAQICDYAENIEDCSKMADVDEKESFLTTYPEIEREISSSDEETKRIDDTAVRDKAFCKQLNDGVYFNDCGNEYIICSRQITFVYNCPEGQIMNPASKTCNEPENIPECVNKNDRI